MSLVSDRCLCLRKTEYSETSQILTLLSRNHGLLRVIAKGAHRTTKAGASKFGGGIDLLDLADVEHAAELGYAVKLIASAWQIDRGVGARVHPCLLGTGHPLAAVDGAFNAVMLQGRSIREVLVRDRPPQEVQRFNSGR